MKNQQQRTARRDALVKNIENEEVSLELLEAMMQIALDENDNVERHILLCAAERAGPQHFNALIELINNFS